MKEFTELLEKVKNESFKKNDEENWLSVSDLMAGLMMVLLISFQ